MNVDAAVINAIKYPKAVDSLKLALKSLNENNDADITLVNYGGQGLIYKLESKNYDFPILIKIPFYSRHMNNEIAEHGILKEARICETILQSGYMFVPKLLSYDSNGRYLIREFIQGEELSYILEHADEKERDSLVIKEFDLVRQAFSVFHDNGIESYVIRDLKPRNIIYSNNGELFLIDCGSCRPEKQMISRNHEKAVKRFGCGKYLHWPIEQLIEDNFCSRKVDYFAWGVMAYYTLFLEWPYDNKTDDLQKAIEEYNRKFEIAKENIEIAYASGRITEVMKNNIIAALQPDYHTREFLI